MDAYIKRKHVLQALTYCGTAEPTDIIPLTLAAARKNVMKIPTREFDEFTSQMIIAKAKREIAREIFEEIERNECHNLFGKTNLYMLTAEQFAELKKKYTEDA